jgi:hypothetical protein
MYFDGLAKDNRRNLAMPPLTAAPEANDGKIGFLNAATVVVFSGNIAPFTPSSTASSTPPVV